MQRPWSVALCTAVVGLALAGCSKPEPPEKDRPPQPTAEVATPVPGAAAADYASQSLSTDQIQAPIDRAKAVEGTVLEAAKQQQADIDAQASGQAPPPAQ